MLKPPFEFGARERVVLSQHPDFSLKHQSVSASVGRLIDEIVDDLKAHPENTGDRLLENTEVGDIWVRCRGDAYVFYQVKTNEPVSPLLVKLWFCGAFTVVNGRVTFDF